MSNEDKSSINNPSTSKKNTTEKSLHQGTAGGKPINAGAVVEFSEKKASYLDEYIHLHVTTLDTNHEILFRIKPVTNLANLKRLCCKALGYRIDELLFVFNEHILKDDDTPAKLYMMDYDVIDIIKPLRRIR